MSYTTGIANTGVPGNSFLSGPPQTNSNHTAALLPFVRSQGPPCPPIVQHSPQPQLTGPPTSQTQQVVCLYIFLYDD